WLIAVTIQDASPFVKPGSTQIGIGIGHVLVTAHNCISYPTVSPEIYPVNPPAYHSSGFLPLFTDVPRTGHQLCRAKTPTSRNKT
ncbi:hypothetical protein STEG23_017732, partial [Scotinomys teguina]